MNFHYYTIVNSIRDDLLLALKAGTPNFESLPATPRGHRAYSAMSLDLHIQHGYVEVSLRTDSERKKEHYIGDWSHAGFLSSLNGPCDEEMARVASTVMSSYNEVSGDDLRARADRRHLLFLAAAEALLDRKVAEVLNGFRIKAPYFGAELGGNPFTYYVCDPDEMLRANYCDIVRSKHVTSRLLGPEV